MRHSDPSPSGPRRLQSRVSTTDLGPPTTTTTSTPTPVSPSLPSSLQTFHLHYESSPRPLPPSPTDPTEPVDPTSTVVNDSTLFGRPRPFPDYTNLRRLNRWTPLLSGPVSGGSRLLCTDESTPTRYRAGRGTCHSNCDDYDGVPRNLQGSGLLPQPLRTSRRVGSSRTRPQTYDSPIAPNSTH